MATRHFVHREYPFAFTNGVQASWLEVDIETGLIKLLKHYAAGDDHVLPPAHHRLRRLRDRLQSRRAESIDRRRRRVDRQPGAERGVPRDVETLRRLRHRAAPHDVVDVLLLYPRPIDRRANQVRGQLDGVYGR